MTVNARNIAQSTRRVRKKGVAAGLRLQARVTPAITQWWDSLPDHDRLPFYSPAAIEAGIGQPMEDLAAALRALGWQRVQVRIVGVATIVWVAPGELSPLRQRGRPPKTAHLPTME